jgi:hypothetical protein
MNYDDIDENTLFDAPTKAEPKIDESAIAVRGSITKVMETMTEFDRVSEGLIELASRFPHDLVYDCRTGAGMVEAIAHRAAWREPRLAVERLRKSAKAPVLALGKDIDARAAWLTEQLLLGETPIHEQIKVEESRKADEKRARELAEFGRVQAIQDAIGEIHMDVMTASGKASAVIANTLEALKTATLDPLVFQELMAQAEAARSVGIAKLEIALKAKLHDEAETAKLAAERAELEELRKAVAAQKAKAAAAAKIEQDRVAAEQAAESKRLKDAAAAQAAQQKQEADRLADERAAFERKRAEFEAAQRSVEAAARAKVGLPEVPAAVGTTAALTPSIAQMPTNVAAPATLDIDRLGFTVTYDAIIKRIDTMTEPELQRVLSFIVSRF